MRCILTILFFFFIHIEVGAQTISATSAPFELKVGYTEGVRTFSTTSETVFLEIGNKKANDIIVVSKPMLLDVGYVDAVVAEGTSNSINLTIQERVVPVVKTPVVATTPKLEPEIDASATNYALIIGVSEYQNSNAQLNDLNEPVNDATKLKNVLTSKYTFKNEDVSLLKNPSRNDILTELEKLADKITDKDNLLLFYAGHGIWDAQLGVGYWLPSDAHPTFKSNWISNSTIRDYIAGIKSKHTLLISDACFAGSIFKARGSTVQLNKFSIVRVNMLTSRKAMTSGTLSVVLDNSKFMEYLIKRLSDLDLDHFTSHQLFSSVETAVMNNTNNLPQYGVIKDTGDEGGDFIFWKKE